MLIKGTLASLRTVIGESWSRDFTATKGLSLSLLAAAKITAPIAVAGVFAGIIGVLAQSRFLIRMAALKFDVSRLNPGEGFKRLFGISGLIELGKATLKLVLMAGASWFILKGQLPKITVLPWSSARSLINVTAELSCWLLGAACAVQGLVAVLDLLIVRIRFQRRYRMSREDLKEEYKDTEGNPHTKSRIRRLQRVKRHNIIQAVQKATVVVTNPTHYAVALVYDKNAGGAPRVAAKGADLVAQQIRELARLNKVPIVEKPALARALFRLEVDAEIPAEHYRAVAEIVAFIWRLNERGRSR